MRGPEKTAMAVRNTSGKIITEEWKNSGKSSPILRLPIIRGIFGMASSLTLGYKCMMRSADIAVQDILAEQPQDSGTDTDAACGTPCPDTADTGVCASEAVTEIAPTRNAGDSRGTDRYRKCRKENKRKSKKSGLVQHHDGRIDCDRICADDRHIHTASHISRKSHLRGRRRILGQTRQIGIRRSSQNSSSCNIHVGDFIHERHQAHIHVPRCRAQNDILL